MKKSQTKTTKTSQKSVKVAKSNQMQPSEDQVRYRAYEIYIERGGQPGREEDDWLQAKEELLSHS